MINDRPAFALGGNVNIGIKSPRCTGIIAVMAGLAIVFFEDVFDVVKLVVRKVRCLARLRKA